VNTLETIRSYSNRHPSGTGAHVSEVGRDNGRMLRAAMTDNTSPAPAGQPASAAVARTATRRTQVSYAEVDALLAQVPVGRYALPIVKSGASGNDVTFFEVIERRGAHMIRVLNGAPGAFKSSPLAINFQFHAARHLLEDLVAATALFGHRAKRCGRCHSPLTKKKSRDQGMGDHCLAERAAGR
jgi:hypothetical protein